ncbi:MAG: hypothetical protein VYE69_21685 [Pseudomonadota bacterium]|nr:hypothetical protein [Pseudomonadota bacterium]MEC9470284.1 hypothetical protein [Pseudomonadota bacterium]MEE2867870.1 hypothetical protein [Pseudomonadota bacterium]
MRESVRQGIAERLKALRTRFVLVWLALAFVSPAAFAQSLSVYPAVDPGRFGAMTCQQLWYVEQEVLAAGRVCLASERARRAFRRAERCISDDEAILPQDTRDYLDHLRSVAADKGCSGPERR